MDKSELDDLRLKLEDPGPNEVTFFDRLRAVGGSVGLDENGELVKLLGPVFIDFEASGLWYYRKISRRPGIRTRLFRGRQRGGNGIPRYRILI